MIARPDPIYVSKKSCPLKKPAIDIYNKVPHYPAVSNHLRMPNAQLEWADFRWADLAGADLTGARLNRDDFHKADMAGIVLAKTNCGDTNFEDANLRGANLNEVIFSHTRMINTDLSGVIGLEFARYFVSTKKRRPSAIYLQLAMQVSVKGCSDEAFQDLRHALERWFS